MLCSCRLGLSTLFCVTFCLGVSLLTLGALVLCGYDLLFGLLVALLFFQGIVGLRGPLGWLLYVFLLVCFTGVIVDLVCGALLVFLLE